LVAQLVIRPEFAGSRSRNRDCGRRVSAAFDGPAHAVRCACWGSTRLDSRSALAFILETARSWATIWLDSRSISALASQHCRRVGRCWYQARSRTWLPAPTIAERFGRDRTIRGHGPFRTRRIPYSSQQALTSRREEAGRSYCHSPSAASSMTAATSFAWTTREAWLPATSFVWACILAANIFCTSGAMTLSFVLIT
jgi:hypothetical protein